ncbi:phosphate signaling complex protein PhoU [Telmatospirillum sp.]|uniref:phosphate signaling complex protein PhoU n=1 Tax=Telmatospirillum sp. TaxID=2079197 RepID=UPI0028487DED|nr:phosphate signaling complex protein PhoU [Telmatospirillum sp.]MDR3438774.1 phosphate signaling complex protein PhoU [Telmatospirillum sp.]
MAGDHTVRSYDEELSHLTNLIARMGGLAEAQLDSAVQALIKRDSDLASKVIAADVKVDEIEHEVHSFTVRLLALRQPVAHDLRMIVGALKISGDLERIADYAANVAKRALVLNQIPPVKPTAAVPRLARLVQEIVKEVLDAFVEQDNDKAVKVWKKDEEVDDMYTSLFRELITYMMEDPRNITACIHLMFIAKNIERIGDHATNIAETIHFLVQGTPIREARPKGETVLPDPSQTDRDS